MDEKKDMVKTPRSLRIGVLRKIGEYARHRSFLRARVTALCVALLLLGGLGGTLAWLHHTTNMFPNKMTIGSVRLQVVENNRVVSGNQTAHFGEGEKKMGLQVPNEGDAGSCIARVSFYPMVTHGADNVQDFEDQGWSNDSVPQNNIMKLGSVTLHFADGWANDWIYKDGMFIYRHVLNRGEKTPDLLKGVTKTDPTTWPSDATAKVQVFAEATQATPADSPALWGCRVNDDGTVELVS